MQIQNLHPWDVGVRRAEEIQEELRSCVSLVDSVQINQLRWIGGADVSYSPGDEVLYGAVVVLRFPELSVVEAKWVKDQVRFPYVPGLLSFREAPVLIKAFSLLRQPPEVMIFDGQGIAHGRGVGLASHAALFLDVPSVGCAKSRLIGDHLPVGMKRGARSCLELEGKQVGNVVRTRDCVNPVFVSPGHRMSFQSAVDLVLATCRDFRVPEPIRMADQLVNRLKKEKPVGR